MKFISAITIAVAAATRIQAAVILPRDGPTDVEVLNFALTLEHLEAAFYKEALYKFSQADFERAGLPVWARGRFSQIAEHEETHVKFLQTAIEAAGAEAVVPCTYKFPLDSPKTFAQLASALEGVGTAAYTGAAQFIENKGYLTAAGTILTVEARHTAWVTSASLKQNPWGTAFDIPLSVNQVYTLASQFITSCPTENENRLLAVKAYPTLTVAAARSGEYTTVAFGDEAYQHGKDLYVAFLTGSGPVFSKISGDKKVEIPEGLFGTVYAVITTDNTEVTDENSVAGPAIVNFPFDSRGNYIY